MSFDFIPDLRQVERVPGLDIPARFSDHPIPGFKDAAGNFIGEGDWVATSAMTKYRSGLRLARVLKVKEVTRRRFKEWLEKPEDEWTESERSYKERYTKPFENWVPKTAVYEHYQAAEVTVLQYFDLRPDSWSRRQVKDPGRMVRYDGLIPFAT